MTIKEIIQKLHITMTDASGQESHFESWMTLNEGICDAIDALKALDKQEPVAFASHGVVNWVADKQFQHEANLYIAPQRTWVGLTGEEEMQIYIDCSGMSELLDAIDAKLKQKNGYAEEKNT